MFRKLMAVIILAAACMGFCPYADESAMTEFPDHVSSSLDMALVPGTTATYQITLTCWDCGKITTGCACKMINYKTELTNDFMLYSKPFKIAKGTKLTVYAVDNCGGSERPWSFVVDPTNYNTQ
jgi:hypothetical protein